MSGEKIGDNDGGRVVGSWAFNAQLPNGKTLNMSGYTLYGETMADLNLKLDVAALVLERQRMIAEIPELEVALEQSISTLGEFQKRHSMLSSKEKLSTAEKTMVEQDWANIAVFKDRIAKGRATIAKHKAVISPDAQPTLKSVA